MNQTLRCAIYIRVSTEEQHLNGLSLPAQKKALTEYAQSHGYTISGYYADEGISARKPMKYRKGLLSLLEEVKTDRLDMILVTKLDRWFRNIKDYNITEDILKAHNCYWKTIYENYDSSTANGQMIINIMLSVNQAECDRTSERIKAVMDYKRSIGEVTSGKCACYGYIVSNNRLIKDEATASIVEDAYQHYFSCYSIRSTVMYLRKKYGEKSPSPGMVERFFKNETYTGRHRDNWDYCEPYLSPEQFEQAQKVTRSKIRSGSYEPYLFSSLIKCPWCGGNYTGYRKKQKRKNGGESIYIKYRCGNKFNPHSCAHLTEHRVEEYMLNHVINIMKTENITLTFLPSPTTCGTETADRRAELERLNLQFQKGRISEKYYDEQFELLTRKINGNDPGEHMSSGGISLFGKSQIAKSPHSFTGNWMQIYENLDKAHKNTFWKSIIRSIHINPDTHLICGFDFIPKREQ